MLTKALVIGKWTESSQDSSLLYNLIPITILNNDHLNIIHIVRCLNKSLSLSKIILILKCILPEEPWTIFFFKLTS